MPARECAALLRARLGDRIVLETDADYDTVRLAWNRAADQHPFAVSIPESTADVIDVVHAAAEAGLRVAPQSTGHGAGALSGTDLSDVVLVSLAHLHGVQVDAASHTARVVGGTLWREVIEAAAPFGMTCLHGSAGDISAIGYTLSGGLSFYGRRHGLAVNALQSVRVVTASGDLVTASATENADLFWAIRGGSGGFGVVVEMQIALLDYADVYAGMMLWDAERATDVAHTWARWTQTAPESATTSLRIMHFPPLPDLPPFIRGRSVVIIDGAVLEPDDAASAVMQPLRALGPEMDTFTRIPAPALVHMHMDPPDPTPGVTSHAMLDALPAPAVDALVQTAMDGRPMISEVRHVGGAIARAAKGGGALSCVAGDYAMSVVDIVPHPSAAPEAIRRTHAVVDALEDWHAPSLAPTFIDEPDIDPQRTFGAALTRLAEVKRAQDPHNMFAASHPVL